MMKQVLRLLIGITSLLLFWCQSVILYQLPKVFDLAFDLALDAEMVFWRIYQELSTALVALFLHIQLPHSQKF